MQQSRQGMRVGRAKFCAGDVDLAIHIWTKALESAYATQDYAAMYVLSKNLGDAFGRLISKQQQQKQKRVTTAAIEALQKSIEYYKYALNVIDECALLDVLGDESHLVLNRSAGHVQATLKRQESKMETLRKLPPAVEEQPCTTCEDLFELLVLDDSDGCLYCQVCYDAFYASVESADYKSSPAKLNTPIAAAPPQEPTFEMHASAELSDTSEPLEIQEESGDAIEDPSTAIADAVHFEVATEDVKTASELSSTTESRVEAIEQRTCEDASNVAPPLPPSEATARATTTKQVYSIPELLALRTQSPVASCPEAILSSPVARGGDSANTSWSTRPADRKSSLNKQAKSSSKYKKAPASNTASKTSSPSSSSVSALPSIELCNLLRDGATSTADIQRMASALFDSSVSGQVGESGGGADGDAASMSSLCHEDTFASDLAFFATLLK